MDRSRYKSFFKKRLEKMHSQMKRAHLRVVILIKPENVFYFSGFNPVLNSQPVFLLFQIDQEPCLLLHSLRVSHGVEESILENIQSYGKWGSAAALALEPEDAIYAILGRMSADQIGMELDYVSVSWYQKICKKLQPAAVKSVSFTINMIKLIKDDYEIQCIRKSAALVDLGVKTTIEYLIKGYAEAEAATEGQYAMRQLWQSRFRDSEICGFGTAEGGMIDSLHIWCLSNQKIAYGCDCPTHYYPKNGDLTLPMAWAQIDGYHAENERTVMVGEVNAFRKNAYDSMLKARESVFNILRPGVSLAILYEAATRVYSEAGFADILPGRVGHGVGCSAHEFPSLDSQSKLLLQPGMVITVEPGLMDTSWGGVRHSDTVLITNKGYELLTQLNNGKIVITTN